MSTGARASELLSATVAGVDPGRQVITVVRKGTRELQELPASTDAFVWLRLYQVEMADLIPKGRRQPLWWTLRVQGPVRSERGVNPLARWCRIRSYLDSAANHGLTALDAITRALVGDPWLPLPSPLNRDPKPQLTTHP